MSPFNPLEFRSFAQALVSQDQREVCYRTAIGRSYYSIFLIARDKTGVTIRRNVHKKVREELAKRNKGAASKLGSLSRLRTVADYEIVTQNPGDADWRNNWERTEKIINDILPKIQGL